MFGDKMCSKTYGLIEVSDLVGGFNPFEKYSSKWVHLPQTGVTIKKMKPPLRDDEKSTSILGT